MSEDKEQGSSAVSALGGLILMAAGGWYYLGGGQAQHVEHISQNVDAQVTADSQQQYAIAKRSGSPMDACVAAGMLAAAHLQAKDEVGFKAAKEHERADCAAAGMPQD
jgi:hypothetical protein